MKRFNNTLLMAAAAVAVRLIRGQTATKMSPRPTVWRFGRRTTSTTPASGSLATLIIVTAPTQRGGRQDQRTQSPTHRAPAPRWAISR